MSKRLKWSMLIHSISLILALLFLLYIAVPQYIEGATTHSYYSILIFVLQLFVTLFLACEIPTYFIEMCDTIKQIQFKTK